LGGSTHAATFLTFSLEGASPKVPPNQFVRKRTKKSLLKNNPGTKNIKEV
jgi:hypothetical protein